jgi:Ca-activated chloride channel homolog
MKRLYVPAFLWLAGASAAGQALFRASVEIVEVDVSVMRNGLAVRGLSSRNFIVRDNGVVQTIDSVSLEELPIDITLVIDVSQSLSGARLASLVQAGEELTDALRRDDQAALVTFSNQIALRLPMTSDRARLRAELQRLTSGGSTALRDAVYLAIQLRPPERTRSLILLFTDGRDTSSWLTEADVIESVQRAGSVIHVVRVGSDEFVRRLADTSGGRTWSATSDRQLRELFVNALSEMRARYLLSYSPRGVTPAGWHQISIQLKDTRGDVTARPGYFVADPSVR